MDKKAVNREKKRLQDLLKRANVPQHQQAVLAPIIDNMAWQRVKLDEAREEMLEEPLTIEFDNGGGQTGVRENPIYKGYTTLWRSYLAGAEKYFSYLPKELQEEAAGLTVLDKVIKMKVKNA